MMWRIPLSLITIMAAVSLVAACSNGDSSNGERAEPAATKAVNITTRTAALRDVKIIETTVGRIRNPRSVTVSAEVPAKVVWIGVDAGSPVNKNDVLVRLDSHDFKAQAAAAKAEIAGLEARIPAQRRLVQRYRKLVADKYISPTMMDHTEAELATLKQSKRAATARYTRARLNLAHTIVHAPISGQVQQRFVAAGDYVKVGMRLVDIVAGGRLTISLPVPETHDSLWMFTDLNFGKHTAARPPSTRVFYSKPRLECA